MTVNKFNASRQMILEKWPLTENAAAAVVESSSVDRVKL